MGGMESSGLVSMEKGVWSTEFMLAWLGIRQ